MIKAEYEAEELAVIRQTQGSVSLQTPTTMGGVVVAMVVAY